MKGKFCRQNTVYESHLDPNLKKKQGNGTTDYGFYNIKKSSKYF